MSKYAVVDGLMTGLHAPVQVDAQELQAMIEDLGDLKNALLAGTVPGLKTFGGCVQYRTPSQNEIALLKQAISDGHHALIAEYCAAKLALRHLEGVSHHLRDTNYTDLGGLAAYHLCSHSLDHVALLKQHIATGDLDHDGYFDTFMHGFLIRNITTPAVVIDVMACLVVAGKTQKSLRAAKSFYSLYRKSAGLTYETWEKACLVYADAWSRINRGDIELAELLVGQIHSMFDTWPKPKQAFLAKCEELFPKLGVTWDDDCAEFLREEASEVLSFLRGESGYGAGKPADWSTLY